MLPAQTVSFVIPAPVERATYTCRVEAESQVAMSSRPSPS